MLSILLGAAAVAALVALVVSTYVGDSLGAQESELARQISARRTAATARRSQRWSGASTRRRPA
jgi:general secretion pathway protein L